jgi:hypothetical protein
MGHFGYNQFGFSPMLGGKGQMEITSATEFKVSHAERIAMVLGLRTDELFRNALRSILREKKRIVLRERLEILSRYGVSTLSELEDGIAKGTIHEHPAWEDLIVIENISLHLEEINGCLDDLQNLEDHRTQ